MEATLTIRGEVKDAGQLAALIGALCRIEGEGEAPEPKTEATRPEQQPAQPEAQQQAPAPQARAYAGGRRVDVGSLDFEEVPPEAQQQAPKATADDVKAAMVKAIDAGRRNDVVQVLSAHGAHGLPDLAEGEYAAVVSELGAL